MTRSFRVLLSMAFTLAIGLSIVEAADLKDFTGAWTTIMPKSVTNKGDDMDLTVTFNEKGKGFPKFVNRDGGVVFFIGAVSADISQAGGRDKVILLREWDVTLSKDKKAMIWSEVRGATKLEFKK